MKASIQKILPVLLIVTCIVLVMLFIRSRKTIPASMVVSIRQSTSASDDVYDGRVQVPGTSLVLSYPTKGFHGLGVKIKSMNLHNQFPDGIRVDSFEPYDPEKGNEFIGLGAHVIETLNAGETFETFVDTFTNSDALNSEYAKKNGVYDVINGHRYFLYHMEDTMTFWEAFAVDRDHVISIGLSYKPVNAKEIEPAHVHYGQLFREIISHIDFERGTRK